ncbi:MAG TPA: transposase [Lacipirellulaceae bacterium]|nr:transposase [Lacipirellulaceae bacterium]
MAELGAVHYGREKLQPRRSEVCEFYSSADEHLEYPRIRFDAEQRDAIGLVFGDVIAERNYTCYACAIMPDHVHMVIRKHRDSAEQMTGNLQGASRTWLRNNGIVSEENPTWTSNGWKVF